MSELIIKDVAYKVVYPCTEVPVFGSKLLSIDIETAPRLVNGEPFVHPKAGLDVHMTRISLVQIYDPSNKTCYVFDVLESGIKFLLPTLKAYQWIAHNAKFELAHMMKAGAEFPTSIHCTMLMSQLINGAVEDVSEQTEDDLDTPPGEKDGIGAYKRTSNSLENCCNRWLGVQLDKSHQASKWGERPLSEGQVNYAAEDAIVTYNLCKLLLQKLNKLDMLKVYNLQKLALLSVVDMETNGISFDWMAHADLIMEWENDFELAKLEALKIFGVVNLASNKQMGEWLKTTLPHVVDAWPKTEKGACSFTATSLADFRHLPQIECLFRWKKLNKLLTTYGKEFAVKFKHPITDRVHTGFTLGETATGRLSSRSPNLQNCFSPDTEILTDEGWKFFPQLGDERVAQWEDGKITFVTPTHYHKYEYDGVMLEIRTTQINLKVTPDHRCLVWPRRIAKHKVVAAKDLKEDFIMQHAGMYPGGTLKMEPSFLQLLIATQADGSYHDKGISFYFQKQRKIKRLLKVLKQLNANYSTGKRYNGQTWIRLKKSPLAEKVTAFLGKDKTLGWWILQLTRPLLDLACNEVMLWDGLSTRKSNYSSSKKINTDVLQALYMLSGRRARQRIYYPPSGNPSYQIDVPFRSHSMTTNFTREDTWHQGYVYCVEVPSSFIVVRRGGSVCITGNCPREPFYRNLYTAAPNQMLVVADFSQIEVRLQAELSQDPVMLEAYQKKEDIYKKFASLLYNKSIEEVTKKERTHGKLGILSLSYGTGPRKLRSTSRVAPYNLEISEDEAYRTHQSYHQTFHRYSTWCDEVREIGERTGYARTLTGKLRRLEPNKVYTTAPNHIVQGTACELMLLAMIKARDAGLTLLLVVHDELIVQCRPEDAEATCEKLSKAMNDAMAEMFPNAVDFHVADAFAGKTWGEAKH